MTTFEEKRDFIIGLIGVIGFLGAFLIPIGVYIEEGGVVFAGCVSLFFVLCAGLLAKAQTDPF